MSIDPLDLGLTRYRPLIRDVRGDRMPGGMLNLSPAEIARKRADEAAKRRREDEAQAQLGSDQRALVEDHRRRLAAARGLHRVMLDWHEPVKEAFGDDLICGHCSNCGYSCCGHNVDWPCPTYAQVLANPE